MGPDESVVAERGLTSHVGWGDSERARRRKGFLYTSVAFAREASSDGHGPLSVMEYKTLLCIDVGSSGVSERVSFSLLGPADLIKAYLQPHKP